MFFNYDSIFSSVVDGSINNTAAASEKDWDLAAGRSILERLELLKKDAVQVITRRIKLQLRLCQACASFMDHGWLLADVAGRSL
jgi:hypothetical protein